MIAFFNFLYSGSFFSIVCIFLFMYVLGLALFTHFKKPARSNAFSLAIPLTFMSWLALNAAPIPPAAQENLKDMLIQQAKFGVGSNALVNTIIMPCQDQGYVRGHDYNWALNAYQRDIQGHVDKTEVFKVTPKTNLDIDKKLEICEFISKFNEIKFKELIKNESVQS
ncbi:hypothetical protein DVA68_15815 [Acinetobacter baumannii]|nr:hypothetical protein DVA68_15815 [Acinetobacter baumannii]